jgi:hypothetical protein
MTSAGKLSDLYCWLAKLTLVNRYLSFVRNAFSGIPTLVKEEINKAEYEHAVNTSDIL